MTDSWSQRIQI